jgi:hypothetical protein
MKTYNTFYYIHYYFPDTMSNLIDTLKSLNYRYIGDDQYVFKKCQDVLRKDKSRKWLVILKKTDSTRTNEGRPGVVNHMTAPFRACKLRVIKIINTNQPTKTIKYLINVYGKTKTKYAVGKIVKSDNFKDDDEVYSGGIHYFKSIEPAIIYETRPVKYTGQWNTWYASGRKNSECQFFNGKPTGQYQIWYDFDNKPKCMECEFLDGKHIGEIHEWNFDGRKILSRLPDWEY